MGNHLDQHSTKLVARGQARLPFLLVPIVTGAILITNLNPLAPAAGEIANTTVPFLAVVPVHPELLTAEDLPSSFIKMPDFIKQPMLKAITSSLQSYFGNNEITVQDLLAFLDFKNLTIALGFTTSLPNEQTLRKFDAGLEGEAALQTFADSVKKSSYLLGTVSIKQQTLLADLPKRIGEVSLGMSVIAETRSAPLFADMVAFRRGKTGAVTILGSLNQKSAAVTVSELAQKMDARLQQDQRLP
jgi:hypothetical protein